jgi:hypothetical protein
MFCALTLILGSIVGVGSSFHVLPSKTRFGGTEDAESSFHVLRSRTRFRQYTKGVGTNFYILCSRTYFRRYRGCWVQFYFLRSQTRFERYRGRMVQFLCFALPDSFWIILRAPSLAFRFCTMGLVLDGTEGVKSSFHILRSRTHFRW